MPDVQTDTLTVHHPVPFATTDFEPGGVADAIEDANSPANTTAATLFILATSIDDVRPSPDPLAPTTRTSPSARLNTSHVLN
jgi:hypothetical protein